MSRKIRVLHVVECYIGGVRTALEGYTRLPLGIEHHLVFSARRYSGDVLGPEPSLFAGAYPLGVTHSSAIASIVRVARDLQPDVLHGHSSFGGAYARLAAIILRARYGMRVPVVYTPHGLSTARRDISSRKRLLFGGFERLLSPLTTVYAGCASEETRLCHRIKSSVASLTVPNAVPQAELTLLPQWSGGRDRSGKSGGVPVVAFSGRIAPQRDPAMAASIARAWRAAGHDAEFVWLGGGEPDQVRVLAAAEIAVTGWLDREDMHARMAGVDVFIHTARWDGFPMTIVEAIHIGVPTLVEDIAALGECPSDVRFSTTEQAVTLLETTLEGRGPAQAAWDLVRSTYDESAQAVALAAAYELASGKDVDGRVETSAEGSRAS